jgi:NTE family protein
MRASMADLDAFLATVAPFDALDAHERAAIAARCGERALPAGARLLTQGARNRTLFVLRSGQVIVRAHQGDRLETLARLSPPAILGEISFLTGRTCSADVDITMDARLVELPLDALAAMPAVHERIVRGLASVLADRLYTTVTADRLPAATPIVLLRPGRAWTSTHAFAMELTHALARELGRNAIAGHVGAGQAHLPFQVEDGLWSGTIAGGLELSRIDRLRADAAYHISLMASEFAAVVITPPSWMPFDEQERFVEPLTPLATHVCALLGPGDPLPPSSDTAVPVTLVAQDARAPSLPMLDGSHRLVPDVPPAAEREWSYTRGSDRFRASVASLARAILGRQVGLALGAGGARGWCHAGVLDALSRAGLPIDAIAGTSMGAVVGGLWSSGASFDALEAAAAEWHRRRHRLREWRLWRMHMASERQLDALFLHYFGDRLVNTTDIPFWANATDIERAEEVVLRDGLLRRVARASMAFPGWTPPVVIDGRVLVDGAVVDPAPAQAVRQMGAAFVITVLAVGPYAPKPLAPRFPRRGYDLFARAFQLSGVAMGLARSESLSDVVIVPDLGDATMLSFERDRELIALGRQTTETQLPAILEAYARMKQARRGPEARAS